MADIVPHMGSNKSRLQAMGRFLHNAILSCQIQLSLIVNPKALAHGLSIGSQVVMYFSLRQNEYFVRSRRNLLPHDDIFNAPHGFVVRTPLNSLTSRQISVPAS